MEYSLFDYIVILFNENKVNKKIYMVLYSKQLILEVIVELVNYCNLMNELYSKKLSMLLYYFYLVGKSKEFFMLNLWFNMKEKEFIIEIIKMNLFKQMFFNDLSMVREDLNYNWNVLIDGISCLEINLMQWQI